jgi:hypothetical protein
LSFVVQAVVEARSETPSEIPKIRVYAERA